MRSSCLPHCLFACVFVLLVGCPASTPTKTTSSKARPLTPEQMVFDVRAAGAMGTDLTVAPLRDPQVEDLRQAITQAELRKDITNALLYADQALKISQLDPDLLQWKAELLLLKKSFAEAEAAAQMSYDKGPKLGALCRRNMKTLSFARKLRGNAAGAATADQKLLACTVAPPPRW